MSGFAPAGLCVGLMSSPVVLTLRKPRRVAALRRFGMTSPILPGLPQMEAGSEAAVS